MTPNPAPEPGQHVLVEFVAERWEAAGMLLLFPVLPDGGESDDLGDALEPNLVVWRPADDVPPQPPVLAQVRRCLLSEPQPCDHEESADCLTAVAASAGVFEPPPVRSDAAFQERAWRPAAPLADVPGPDDSTPTPTPTPARSVPPLSLETLANLGDVAALLHKIFDLRDCTLRAARRELEQLRDGVAMLRLELPAMAGKLALWGLVDAVDDRLAALAATAPATQDGDSNG